jgi:hypothetical protein
LSFLFCFAPATCDAPGRKRWTFKTCKRNFFLLPSRRILIPSTRASVCLGFVISFLVAKAV